MRFILALLVFFVAHKESHAQKSAYTFSDSLSMVRTFMETNAYQNSIKVTNSKFNSLLEGSKKWKRKNKIAKIILPAGPVIAAGGIYLAYDAIEGIPMIYVENGVEYPYVVRSLPKLLGGLAAFVTGLSLVESANETKTNAGNWFNSTLTAEKKVGHNMFQLDFGITDSRGLGIEIKF